MIRFHFPPFQNKFLPFIEHLTLASVSYIFVTEFVPFYLGYLPFSPVVLFRLHLEKCRKHSQGIPHCNDNRFCKVFCLFRWMRVLARDYWMVNFASHSHIDETSADRFVGMTPPQLLTLPVIQFSRSADSSQCLEKFRVGFSIWARYRCRICRQPYWLDYSFWVFWREFVLRALIAIAVRLVLLRFLFWCCRQCCWALLRFMFHQCLFICFQFNTSDGCIGEYNFLRG
mmetsp:Transcript_21849/g.45941  ORF Transcript_21849/g.45941 Transcript_21849/m.45941 type:complete len:228 (+) Transcript_21849:397-1080(+)